MFEHLTMSIVDVNSLLSSSLDGILKIFKVNVSTKFHSNVSMYKPYCFANAHKNSTYHAWYVH